MVIQEVPINVEENVEDNQEIVEDNQENVEDIQEPEASEEVEPTPKRRGRPPGAKNKAKSKPKAAPIIKRSVSRRRPPTPEDSEESEEEEEYQPPPRPRRRQQEVDPNPMRTVAAEMLHLMHSQSANRQQARVNKYASWFPQSYA